MNDASSLENSHRVSNIRILILLYGLTAGAAGWVRADEPDQSATRGQLQEIIVTAQKRSENLQQVPIAMQAYTGEQLQNAGVSQLTDITRLAPNLNVVVQNALSQHIVIRGVGTNEFFGNAPSSGMIRETHRISPVRSSNR